jgi:predicted nuclease with RNAse H fold
VCGAQGDAQDAGRFLFRSRQAGVESRQGRSEGRDVADKCVGINVGGSSIHCVALSADGHVTDSAVIPAQAIDEVVGWLSGADAVAVDSPEELSRAPHSEDPTLSKKFQHARCAEIALGRARRIWVPWVTPTCEPVPAWMEAGFRLFSELKAAGHHPIEVFPYAAFSVLVGPGARLLAKRTVGGVLARVGLLSARGVKEPSLAVWSHDGLDALLAAVIARDWAEDRAQRVTCGHDGSAIWLSG